MATVTIRNLDDEVKDRLRVMAAAHRRWMEWGIRAILVEAVSRPSEQRGMLSTLMERFGDLGGVDLEIPVRKTSPRAAELSS
jgi:plasmid stability protein